ncbi:unnamed protein product [Closterium sp. NIES-64]|nr:unnamed protein product [Closterium sp. NIES-64]
MFVAPLSTVKGSRSALRDVTNENDPATQMKPAAKRRFGDALTNTIQKPISGSLNANTTQKAKTIQKAQPSINRRLKLEEETRAKDLFGSALKGGQNTQANGVPDVIMPLPFTQVEKISSAVQDLAIEKDTKGKTVQELIALNDIDALAELYAADGVERMPMDGDSYEAGVKAQADEEIRQRIDMIRSIRVEPPCLYGFSKQHKDPDTIPLMDDPPMPSPPGGNLPSLSLLDGDDYMDDLVGSFPGVDDLDVGWSALE